MAAPYGNVNAEGPHDMVNGKASTNPAMKAVKPASTNPALKAVKIHKTTSKKTKQPKASKAPKIAKAVHHKVKGIVKTAKNIVLKG